MKKRDLIFLDQMIRKLASPYFVENDLYKAVKIIENHYKKAKD